MTAKASLLALLLLPTALYAQVTREDSLALVALYNATNGDQWIDNTNWLTDNPVSTWKGVFVVQDRRVVWLDLRENNLVGTLPSEIGDLTGLRTLRLQSNRLTSETGEIPTVLSQLTSLNELNLSGNLYTGMIPVALSKLTNLTRLFLGSMTLEGEIPWQLSQLTRLQQLGLNRNMLEGKIPPELGQLTDLTDLFLSFNRLHGEIPSVLGNLTNLQRLSLQENQFTGAVPLELVQLTRLNGLWLEKNNLEDLPDLSSLKDTLTDLRVEGNRLTFEDLEPNIDLFRGDASRYVPQDSVGVAGSLRFDEGEPLELSFSVGGAFNEYQWFFSDGTETEIVGDDTLKIFTPLEGEASATFVVDAVEPLDQGFYELEITNSVVGQLKLRSRTIRVDVDQGPRILRAIPETVLQVGGEDLEVDLATVFDDPNDDPLTFEARSADPTIARATLKDTTIVRPPLNDTTKTTLLVVTLDDNPEPRARVSISVTAIDETFDEPTDLTFDVLVNYAPTVASALPDTFLAIGVVGFQKNLRTFFSDPDGDPLTFTPTSSLPSSVSPFIATDSILVVSLVSPAIGDTVLITVTADDERGGMVVDDLEILIDAAPNVLVTSEDEATSATPYEVQALITDNQQGTEAALFFRQAGEIEFDDEEMTPSEDNLYSHTLAETEVRDRGIELYIVATDSRGLETRAPSEEGTYISVPVRIPDPGLEKSTPQPGGGAATGYRLISIPLDLEDKRPSAVLEDDLGGYDPATWRFFEPTSGSAEAFPEFPNTSQMEAGKAFWLLVKDSGKTIDTGDGVTAETHEAFDIELQPGWNAIGNPFNFPIPVRNIQLLGQTLHIRHFDGTDWQALEPDDEILPFEGYIVYNDTENRTELLICPALSGVPFVCPVFRQSPDARQDAPADTLSWAIRIVAQGRRLRDTETVAAVAAKASAAWDRFDRPEPPRSPGDYVSVYFSHPEWNKPTPRYSRDARPIPDDGAVWPFEVTTTAPDKVSLTFEGLAGVPPPFEVWLVDDVVQTAQNLRQTPTYTVAVTTGPRSLKLVVGKPSFIDQEIQESQEIPARFELFPNFPNPFNPSTTIRYGVPEAAPVSLIVYNMLGQKVATLLGGTVEQAAGYHAVVWDGRSDAGTPVASGVYFARMRAGHFSQTQKMVLVK